MLLAALSVQFVLEGLLIFFLIKCEQPQDGLKLCEYAFSQPNYRLFYTLASLHRLEFKA